MIYNEIFNKKFSNVNLKKTAIYGTGEISKDILSGNITIEICGVYDKNLEEGFFLNKKILNISDIKKDNIKRIIIAASVDVTKIIFNRIKKICENNNVELVNIYNENLKEKYKKEKREIYSYFKISKSDLLKKVEEYEAISFDIFDTLIVRKTYEPHDVFHIIEKKCMKNFSKYRIEAEMSIVKSIPNIYEIYEEFQRLTNISNEEKKNLIQMEILIEKKILIPRKETVEIFNYCIASGKKVNLISDMHLTKEILVDILNENGIKGYDKIFISSEYHNSKVMDLYNIYKKKVSAKTYLHIGDNYIYDYEYAKRAGINSFILKSPREILEISSLKNICNNIKTFEDRIIVGMCIAKMFNSPFVLHNTNGIITIDSLEIFAYVSMAPILCAFYMWLIDGCKERVILAARDGFLFKKLSEKMGREDIYLLVSRIALKLMNIKTENDFSEAIKKDIKTSYSDCLKERFDLNIEMELGKKDIYKIYESDILSKSSDYQKNYKYYIKSLNMLKKEKVFFDFISSGTSLKLLKKIFDLKLKGKFFYRYNINEKENLQIESYLNEEEGRRFWEWFKLYEVILASDNGSFLYFDSEKKEVYEREYREDNQINIIKSMQGMIVEFFEEMLFMNVEKNITKELVMSFASLFSGDKAKIKDENKYEIYLYDSYGEGKIKIF